MSGTQGPAAFAGARALMANQAPMPSLAAHQRNPAYTPWLNQQAAILGAIKDPNQRAQWIDSGQNYGAVAGLTSRGDLAPGSSWQADLQTHSGNSPTPVNGAQGPLTGYPSAPAPGPGPAPGAAGQGPTPPTPPVGINPGPGPGGPPSLAGMQPGAPGGAPGLPARQPIPSSLGGMAGGNYAQAPGGGTLGNSGLPMMHAMQGGGQSGWSGGAGSSGPPQGQMGGLANALRSYMQPNG